MSRLSPHYSAARLLHAVAVAIVHIRGGRVGGRGHLVLGVVDVGRTAGSRDGHQVPGSIVGVARDLVVRGHRNAEAALRAPSIRRRSPGNRQQIPPGIETERLSPAVGGIAAMRRRRFSGGHSFQIAVGERASQREGVRCR